MKHSSASTSKIYAKILKNGGLNPFIVENGIVFSAVEWPVQTLVSESEEAYRRPVANLKMYLLSSVHVHVIHTTKEARLRSKG
jgi:hypothetical protein